MSYNSASDAYGDSDDEVVEPWEWDEPDYEEDWDEIDEAIDAEDRKCPDVSEDRVRRLIELANRWATRR